MFAEEFRFCNLKSLSTACGNSRIWKARTLLAGSSPSEHGSLLGVADPSRLLETSFATTLVALKLGYHSLDRLPLERFIVGRPERPISRA